MMSWLLRASFRREAPAPEPLPEGVALRYATWLPRLAGLLAGMRGPAGAVTLGRTIVVHPSLRMTPRILRHELAHVRQWQEHPWTFPVRYTIAHLHHGYTNNPYEIEARAAEQS
jgi:hypothetical protein